MRNEYPDKELCDQLRDAGMVCQTSFGAINRFTLGSEEYTILPSIAELFDLLPDHISLPDDEGKGWEYSYQLMINKRVSGGCDIFYARFEVSDKILLELINETLPNGLAKMALALIKSGLFCFDDDGELLRIDA